jgi:gliding motility-associated-like protein
LFAAEQPLIRFKENKNQWPAEVRYMGEFFNGKVFLESNAFVYELINPEQLAAAIQKGHDREHPPTSEPVLSGHVYKTVFVNALTPAVTAEDKQVEYYNYFLGQDQSKWSSHVAAFKKINYTGLYKGVDMQVYSEGANLKYDLIVAPHADAEQINVEIQHADAVSLSGGKLLITTNAGTVAELAPVAFQQIGRKRSYVKCAYVLSNNIVSFSFPDGYNTNYELVIDPVVIACTFTGGTDYSNAGCAAYDESGNGYLGGDCLNQNFPVTTGAFQATMNGIRDITFHKFNADGSRLLHATYLGGNAEERSLYMDVRRNEAILIGYTESPDFPTGTGAFDNSYNGGADIFLAKFDTSGTSLLQSTYIGGSGKEGKPNYYSFEYMGGSEFVRDSKGDIYVASWTNSLDFPVSSSGFSNHNSSGSGQDDAVILKLDSAMTTLLWSTYLGGANTDQAHSLRLDGNNGVYCVGTTSSFDFPVTTGTIATIKKQLNDCFVVHLDNTGSNLIASTYIGTSGSDYGNRMAIDDQNNVYISAIVDLPNGNVFTTTTNAYSSPSGKNLLMKVSADLSQYIFKARFGQGGASSSSLMFPAIFDIDSCGNIYLGGDVGPNAPTTPNAIKQTTASGDYDLYLAVFTPTASSISYATYIGGSSWEGCSYGKGRIDKHGYMYLGFYGSADTPASPNAWSASPVPYNYSSGMLQTFDHGFLKFDPQTFLTATSYMSGQNACTSDQVAFINQGASNNIQWNFGDGSAPVFLQDTISHQYTLPGSYNVTLIATDTSTCNNVDTLITQVQIYDPPQVNLPDSTDLCLNTEVTLSAVNPGSTYLWSTGATTSSIIASQQGSYSVAVTNSGCTVNDQTEVILSKANYSIVFPNIITPNGDGVNDSFDLSAFYVNESDLHIFDRWGREVFSSTSTGNAWNGSIKGKVVDGTYFYTLRYTTDCIKALQEIKGYITVVR